MKLKEGNISELSRKDRACAKLADRDQWQEVAMKVSGERDNLLKIMKQALPIIDAYRRVSGGDGDVSAADFRAALNKHEWHK